MTPLEQWQQSFDEARRIHERNIKKNQRRFGLMRAILLVAVLLYSLVVILWLWWSIDIKVN